MYLDVIVETPGLPKLLLLAWIAFTLGGVAVADVPLDPASCNVSASASNTCEYASTLFSVGRSSTPSCDLADAILNAD